MNAPSTIRARFDADRRTTTRDAWTAFWQEPGQSQCLTDAPDIRQILTDHWASFAVLLGPGARILDLGCGGGAVARELASARRDIHVTGIDVARIPLAIHRQFELLSDTEMETLPFADASFAAAVSQFGYEYSETGRAAEEIARVLAPSARFSFIVHHAASSIVAADRRRSNAINSLQEARAAFCAGDAAALAGCIAMLTTRHPHDRLIAELARALPSQIGRTSRERIAIWTAIEGALAPERTLSDALQSCCVAPEMLNDWLAPLRNVSEALSVSALRTPHGDPIAWRIEGARRPTNA